MIQKVVESTLGYKLTAFIATVGRYV